MKNLQPILLTEMLSLLDIIPARELPSPILKAEIIRSRVYTLDVGAEEQGIWNSDIQPGQIQVEFKWLDRKSTRLNSSQFLYLVCRLLLEKKNK